MGLFEVLKFDKSMWLRTHQTDVEPEAPCISSCQVVKMLEPQSVRHTVSCRKKRV
jgi:hypothetical protein